MRPFSLFNQGERIRENVLVRMRFGSERMFLPIAEKIPRRRFAPQEYSVAAL